MLRVGNRLKVIGFALSFTILVVLAIAVPSDLWTAYFISAVGALLVTIVVPFVAPIPASSDRTGDAQKIWLIGPLGSMHIGLFLLATATLVLALMQLPVLSWVGVALWCGLSLAGYLSLGVGAAVVQEAAGQTVPASADERTKWAVTLRQVLLASPNAIIQKRIRDSIEKIRFAGNDFNSQISTENVAISSLICQIASSMEDEGEQMTSLEKVERLLVQREDNLRSVRSKA